MYVTSLAPPRLPSVVIASIESYCTDSPKVFTTSSGICKRDIINIIQLLIRIESRLERHEESFSKNDTFLPTPL